jgi:two-component system cell cycle response regulator
MSEEWTLHDYIRIGYLGLPTHEARVMKTIFTLSPELKESYILTGMAELKKADLVLVNVDDANAVNLWNKLENINKTATPITLSAHGKTIDGIISLTLPIRLQMLIEAMENVLKDSTKINIPVDTAKGETPLEILVVDDSYPVRKYMEQKLAELAELPTRLSFADSGEQAMRKFKRRIYDMVFLDVMMEGVDGYKVCKTIKSRFDSYVVMLTGKKSPFDKVRGTMSGCDAYITKPPADERLIGELKKCSKYREKKQGKVPAAIRTAVT